MPWQRWRRVSGRGAAVCRFSRARGLAERCRCRLPTARLRTCARNGSVGVAASAAALRRISAKQQCATAARPRLLSSPSQGRARYTVRQFNIRRNEAISAFVTVCVRRSSAGLSTLRPSGALDARVRVLAASFRSSRAPLEAAVRFSARAPPHPCACLPSD